MNIGFDLDGVFIDKPPIIPKDLLERLYRKNSGNLVYRFPKKPEQVLRKLVHFPVFRQPIKSNISYLQNIAKKNTHSYFLISGRFGFIKKETDHLLKKYHLTQLFKELYINYENHQPHFFKEKQIKRLEIKKFIDDDLSLLHFLSKRNQKTTFYWFNSKTEKKISKNLIAITKLSRIFK